MNDFTVSKISVCSSPVTNHRSFVGFYMNKFSITSFQKTISVCMLDMDIACQTYPQWFLGEFTKHKYIRICHRTAKIGDVQSNDHIHKFRVESTII